MLDGNCALSRLAVGDSSCTSSTPAMVAAHLPRRRTRVDPLEESARPAGADAYDGWGILPDQYLRRFADDDATPAPVDQRNRDLPPCVPGGAHAAPVPDLDWRSAGQVATGS